MSLPLEVLHRRTGVGISPLAHSFGGWAHPLMMSVCAIGAEGAPSLRFLQGRVRCCRHNFCGCATRSRMRSRFPPFAKCAKDGAPTMFLAPARSRAWATRPIDMRVDMRILKAMLVVTCIMSAISIFRPIVLPGGTFGIVSSILDTAVFDCAFHGIHRRALLMWKLGFAIIVGLGAQFLIQSLTIWSSILGRATSARMESGFLHDYHARGDHVLAALVEATEALLHRWFRVVVEMSPLHSLLPSPLCRDRNFPRHGYAPPLIDCRAIPT